MLRSNSTMRLFLAIALLGLGGCRPKPPPPVEPSPEVQRSRGELRVVLVELWELVEDAVDADLAQTRAEATPLADLAVRHAESLALPVGFRARLARWRDGLPTTDVSVLEDEMRALKDEYPRLVTWPAPPTKTDAIEGRRLYAAACAPCHGINGTPPDAVAAALHPAPTDLRTLARTEGLDLQWVQLVVEHGVPTTAMPAFRDAFSVTQRWNIAVAVASMR